MRDLDQIIKRAKQLDIMEDKEHEKRIDIAEEEDEEEVSISEIHDYLLFRGRVLGFRNALNEAFRSKILTEEEVFNLKNTIFSDELQKELKKSRWFAKTETQKEFETENEELDDIVKFLRNKNKEEQNV